ncbi:MAG: AAA family ATPase, partial [Pseudonocardiales bacterium]|nr:AAA family ATPase [Pseudonocardiales bacterium]
MLQGVGRLLLDSEMRGGSIDPRATRRTAFVVAGGHALTARHCSSDATGTDLLWLRLPAPGDEFGIVDLPVRVVDEDAALDVAVLGVDPGRVARGDDSGGSAAELLGRVSPVPVGVPVTAGEPIRTQGYPRDARDGGLAFTGKVVDSAALLRKHRVHGLQLQIDELAASVPHGPGGHSGGPVLATGTGQTDLVVGVVRAYPADETRQYAVGGSLLASRVQDLAERFPAVRDAFAQQCLEMLGQASTPAMAQAPSLATLIRADARHTRFFGREPELAQLHSWCATDDARAAMLMTGPAGQGKTRLARHLCEQLTTTEQWIAVPLRGIGNGDGMSAGLAMAALAQRPLLLAVDYAAEYGAMNLRTLVDQLCTQGPPRWRLLLIARHTGDWWDGDITTGVLAGLRAAAVEVPGDPLPLAELVGAGDDRQDAYDFILGQLRAPVAAFALQHGLTVRADPPRPPLQRPEYGSALMLHIAAVCALLPDSRPGTRSAVRLDPANVVNRFLDLERDHHWLYCDTTTLHHTTETTFGKLATGEAGRYLV